MSQGHDEEPVQPFTDSQSCPNGYVLDGRSGIMNRYDEVLSNLDDAIATMQKSGTTGPKMDQYLRMRTRLVDAGPGDLELAEKAQRMMDQSQDLSAGLQRTIDRYRRPERGRRHLD